METSKDYLNVLSDDGKTFLLFKPRIKARTYERTVSVLKAVATSPPGMVELHREDPLWLDVDCREILTVGLKKLGYSRRISASDGPRVIFRLGPVVTVAPAEPTDTTENKPDSKLFAAGVVLAVLALLAWSVSGLWGALS